MGVPYEFHPPDSLPPLSSIAMTPPVGFPRAHQVPPGTWSDDGAQALALLSSLLDHDGFLDVPDFARRLLAWRDRGVYAVDNVVFDIGIQTSCALDKLKRGVAPLEAGGRDEQSNGNGSLMRTLPLALAFKGDDAALVRAAHEQPAITHGHPRSQACCALYALWARRELDGIAGAPAFEEATTVLRGIYADPEYSSHRVELEERVLAAQPKSGRGSGYVVDSLASVRLACEKSSYEAIIKAAIALGNDTDTTACIAGGIAGIRYGRKGIGEDLVKSLRGKGVLDSLVKQLREAWEAGK